MAEPEPHHLRFAAVEPTAVTRTPEGAQVELSISASDQGMIDYAANAIAKGHGTPVFVRDTKTNTSRTIGLGGTKWNARWQPSGDVARAAKAAEIAKQRGQQGDPRAN